MDEAWRAIDAERRRTEQVRVEATQVVTSLQNQLHLQQAQALQTENEARRSQALLQESQNANLSLRQEAETVLAQANAQLHNASSSFEAASLQARQQQLFRCSDEHEFGCCRTKTAAARAC